MTLSPTVCDTPAPAPARAPGASARRSSHLAGLDGLRAIAVGAVILYHLGSGILPGGYLGVDVFFVISGFLITGLVVREKDSIGRIRLGGFWMRRARRLLPALALVVGVSASAALVVGGNPLVHLGRQVLGAATFSSNWLSIVAAQSYFDETTPELFRNLWSLAVEEQFYLVWPLVILFVLAVRSRRARVFIVLAIAAGSAVAMVILAGSADPSRVYYGSDTHSFGLAIGAALAILHRDWPASTGRLAERFLPALAAIAVFGIVALMIMLPADNPLVYRGGLVLVAMLSVVAIAGAIIRGSRVGALLDWSPLRWIGARSYGLYLWHWPVFVLVTDALPTPIPLGTEWILGGITLTITVAFAGASYRFIEHPIHRNGLRATLSRWIGTRPRSVQRTGAIGLAIALLLTLSTTTGLAIVADPGMTDAQAAITHGRESVLPSSPAPSPPATTGAQTGAQTGAPSPGPVPVPGSASVPGGDQIDAIGDSVMLASAKELQAGFPGIQIDAVVSRQLSSAPAIVRQLRDSGTLRPVLLIGLGTNGPIDRQSLDQIRSIVGPRREIVVVSVQAPRGWTDGVNGTLTRFAEQYRSVELANWREAISTRLDLLARDQIHPGPAGGLIYVRAVTDALQRLANLPPARGPNDFRLTGAPL